MKNVSNFQMVVRITGLLQLVLGLVTWTGKTDFLVPVHILFGLILVASLLALSYFASRSAIPTGLVILFVTGTVLLLVLGLTQEKILPETGHWIIQVLHLLLGVGAIGMAEMLGSRIKKISAIPTH